MMHHNSHYYYHHHRHHHHHHYYGNNDVHLTIDGIHVTVPEGTRILEAAEKAGVRIPTLCDHPGLARRAVCRLCVVEADGRTRLYAACANEVWEGAKIVTNNHRILMIRKTIIEMLLADHPQDCLKCVRGGKCELQALAGIYCQNEQLIQLDQKHIAGQHEKIKPVQQTGNDILVRDMDKCIKCGRCVEICQEVMTVRALNTAHRSADYEVCTPYGEAISEGPCIGCGHCAELCPTGALYERDQTAQVQAALDDKEQHLVTQLAAAIAPNMDNEFKLPPGTVTGGKLVTALKQLGFDKVFDAGISSNITIANDINELLNRMNNKTDSAQSGLPLIIGCSPSWNRFVKTFYPDLLAHLSDYSSPEQVFGALAKKQYNNKKTTYVSVMHCIAKKLESQDSENVDIALTTRELAQMIRSAGIDMSGLPESPFDTFDLKNAEEPSSTLNAIVSRVYGAYKVEAPGSPDFKELRHGISEAEIELNGQQGKVLLVKGYAHARRIMDSIRKGECDAALVLVMNCTACNFFTMGA